MTPAQSPATAAIDAVVRCTACGASIGGCDCWDDKAYRLAIVEFAQLAGATCEVRSATAWLKRRQRKRGEP